MEAAKGSQSVMGKLFELHVQEMQRIMAEQDGTSS